MIRQAQARDLDALIALFREENSHNHNIAPDRVGLTEAVLTQDELNAMISDQASYLAVYELDGTPVAALLGVYHQTEAKRWVTKRRYVYLEELIVTQAQRGKGIARQLVDEFEDWACSKGASCIDLHVWQHNDSAIKFYQGQGFYNEQCLMSKNLE